MYNAPLEKKTILIIADVFRMMLINGLPCKDEIVKWADENLKSESPESAFLAELSLSATKDVNQLITYLDLYVGYERQVLSARIFLSILQKEFDAGNLRLEKIVQTMDWLTRHTLLSTEEKSLLNGIDDKLRLASSNVFGEQKEVEKEVRRFLQMYIDFRLENPLSWSGNSDRLEGEVRRLFQIVREERAVFIQQVRIDKQKRWWKWW